MRRLGVVNRKTTSPFSAPAPSYSVLIFPLGPLRLKRNILRTIRWNTEPQEGSELIPAEVTRIDGFSARQLQSRILNSSLIIFVLLNSLASHLLAPDQCLLKIVFPVDKNASNQGVTKKMFLEMANQNYLLLTLRFLCACPSAAPIDRGVGGPSCLGG